MILDIGLIVGTLVLLASLIWWLNGYAPQIFGLVRAKGLIKMMLIVPLGMALVCLVLLARLDT